MLKFNVRRVLSLRDVDRYYGYLTRIGFTHMTASNMVRGNVSAPKVEHIERLCRALNCTPNDLFEWVPETGERAVGESHRLNTLRHDKSKGLNEMMKNVPLEKLGEVEEFLKGMKET